MLFTLYVVQVESCFHQLENTFTLLHCEQTLFKWKSVAAMYKTGILCCFPKSILLETIMNWNGECCAKGH